MTVLYALAKHVDKINKTMMIIKHDLHKEYLLIGAINTNLNAI